MGENGLGTPEHYSCISLELFHAVLLSLTTSCAATCQKQPASPERRLVLLEHEGLGLPAKVLYVGTAGQQPLMLERSWHPQDEQESFIFWSKYSN